jgi:very-short-patch-repair endonuclease
MPAPKPHLKYELARRFRQELTDAEARLWVRIKGKPEGVHFRKQHPVGIYILDFYCAAARLAIEVEGQIHNVPEIAAQDEIRFRWLEAHGFEVMRLTGADVMGDPDEAAQGVVLRAQALIAQRRAGVDKRTR